MVREAPEPIPKCQRDLAGSGKMVTVHDLTDRHKINVFQTMN